MMNSLRQISRLEQLTENDYFQRKNDFESALPDSNSEGDLKERTLKDPASVIEKPFDLLFIIAPDEFGPKFSRISPHIEKLADICRAHNIPVIVRDFTTAHEDIGLERMFSGTNYKRITEDHPNDLIKYGNSQEAKVLVIGSRLCYSYDFSRMYDAGLKEEELENFDVKDKTRRFATVQGCVPVSAREIHLQILSQNRTPHMYIDPRASVSGPEIDYEDGAFLTAFGGLSGDNFDSEVVYTLVDPVLERDTNPCIYGLTTVLLKKVPRETIFGIDKRGTGVQATPSEYTAVESP